MTTSREYRQFARECVEWASETATHETRDFWPATIMMCDVTQCRECAIQMKLVSVTQTDEGLEDRTFECPKCHERDTRVFISATLEQRA
jgi:hypothetical protein